MRRVYIFASKAIAKIPSEDEGNQPPPARGHSARNYLSGVETHFYLPHVAVGLGVYVQGYREGGTHLSGGSNGPSTPLKRNACTARHHPARHSQAVL